MEEDADTRQEVLSEFLPDLAEATTPSNDTFIFPQDLVTTNDLLDDVISVLTVDTVNGVAVELQTVRFLELIHTLYDIMLPSGCSGCSRLTIVRGTHRHLEYSDQFQCSLLCIACV